MSHLSPHERYNTVLSMYKNCVDGIITCVGHQKTMDAYITVNLDMLNIVILTQSAQYRWEYNGISEISANGQHMITRVFYDCGDRTDLQTLDVAKYEYAVRVFSLLLHIYHQSVCQTTILPQ